MLEGKQENSSYRRVSPLPKDQGGGGCKFHVDRWHRRNFSKIGGGERKGTVRKRKDESC